jgi:hypothetical protein
MQLGGMPVMNFYGGEVNILTQIELMRWVDLERDWPLLIR